MRNSDILIKKEYCDIRVRIVKYIILTLFILIAMNMYFEGASAFINTNATNNADTFLMQNKAKENFGYSDSLGIFGAGNRMITLMSWTLPVSYTHLTLPTIYSV